MSVIDDVAGVITGRDAVGHYDHFSRHPDIFHKIVEMSPTPMLLTDPKLPDNPIAFANKAFIKMTGYSKKELIGRNCRFLQGPSTDSAAVDAIRSAIAARVEITIELLNYRKGGGAFWTALFCTPVYGPDDELTYFFSTQIDVSSSHAARAALADSLRKKE